MIFRNRLLLAFVAVLVLAPAWLLAQNTAVIPQPVDLSARASAQIYAGNFSTDPLLGPQVLAAVGQTGAGGMQLFIINRNVCAPSGDSLTYKIFVRNTGDNLVQNIVLQNLVTGGEIINSSGDGAAAGNALTWTLPDLAPNAFTEVTFTIQVNGGFVQNSATLTFNGGAVQTSHTVDGTCEVPDIPRAALPNKVAAIICDASETACNAFFPSLGNHFQEAQNRTNQPRICSREDTRGCAENQPELGARYNQATPTILPGECRVAEDATLGFGRDNPLSGPPVETSWCESNGYPQFVIRNAPAPAKEGNLTIPDTSGLDGNNTNINSSLVAGDTCGGKPGDPHWAPSCQCRCGETIVCPFDGELKLCQSCYPITRHDVFVTSQEECLLDGPKHQDAFF